jgi:hypothetical protein
MNTDPVVTHSFNLKIQGQEFSLTETEAYSIYNQLHKILGIVEPKTWPDFPYVYGPTTANPVYPIYPTVFYTTSISAPNTSNWKTQTC